MTIRTILLTLAACASLGAQTVNLLSSSGLWRDPQGNPDSVSISTLGPSTTIAWGGQSGPTSSLQFGGKFSPAFNLAEGALFEAGTFTHANNPLNAQNFLTGVTLDVTLNLEVPGGFPGSGAPNLSPTFTFVFEHDETSTYLSTDPNICPYGGADGQGVNRNGCADRVLVASAPAPQSFTIGDTVYTFHLGFFQLGRTGITAISEFLTPEQDATTAKMYGYFTTSAVPEPGFYGLLGAGFAALFAAVRRRRRS